MKFFKKKNTIIIDKAVFDQYYHKIYQVAFYITKDQYIAQDVVQETFIKAINKVDTLEDQKKIGSWLTTIATRTAFDMMRKEAKWVTVEFDDFIEKNIDHQPSSVEKKVESRMLLENVTEEIEKLEPIYKMVITLKYFAGLTNEEVAEALDISLGTVKSRIHRAKAKLKKQFDNEIKKEGIL